MAGILEELRRAIDVNTPIIYIQHYDMWRIDLLIEDAVGGNDDEHKKIQEWNPATSKTDFTTKRSANDGNSMPLTLLLKEHYNKFKRLDKDLPYRYLVIKDAHEELEDTQVITYLHLIAQRRLYDQTYNTTIFIVDNILNIPKEIEKYVTIFSEERFILKDDDEIIELINEHATVNGYKDIDDDDRKALMPTLRGLSKFDIDRILDVALSSNGSLEEGDKKTLLEQKKAMVKKAGVIEIVDSPDNIDSIGGLENLKEYLERKAKVVNNLGKAQERGVEIPKGVFIVGMPGCGKSLCAKATASLFNAPLLKLDMGSMMGKYVGDSEANLRKALAISEAASPCVLWIDEIEKGFSGVGKGENDVLMRMFGYFLSWMQEKKSAVYVVATANNAENLPPELKRKGRFDEIFYVDLPNKEEIKKIIEIHLNKGDRKKCRKAADLQHITDSMCQKFSGCNGADIEAVIKEAIENCFIDEKEELSWQDIEAVLKKTNSISVISKKQIDAMKNVFKENHFTNASK